jgi:hypothetical protein
MIGEADRHLLHIFVGSNETKCPLTNSLQFPPATCPGVECKKSAADFPEFPPPPPPPYAAASSPSSPRSSSIPYKIRTTTQNAFCDYTNHCLSKCRFTLTPPLFCNPCIPAMTSPSASDALPYPQRPEAILRAPQLPNVINLGKYYRVTERRTILRQQEGFVGMPQISCCSWRISCRRNTTSHI